MERFIKDAVSGWEAVWVALFEERAAVREFDGEASRKAAERMAYLEVGRMRSKAKERETM